MPMPFIDPTHACNWRWAWATTCHKRKWRQWLHDFAYYGSLSAGLTAESFDLWCGYQMGLAFHGLEMGLGIQCYFDGLDYYDCQPNTTIRLQLAPSRKSLYRAGSPSFERSRGLFMRADLLIVLPGVSMGFQFDPHHQVSLGLLGFSEVAFVQAGYRYHLLTNKWSPYADARLMLHMYGELAGMVQVGLSYKDMDLGVGALIVRDDYELHALAPCLTAGYTLRPQTSEYRDHHSVGHPTYRGHFLLAE